MALQKTEMQRGVRISVRSALWFVVYRERQREGVRCIMRYIDQLSTLRIAVILSCIGVHLYNMLLALHRTFRGDYIDVVQNLLWLSRRNTAESES